MEYKYVKKLKNSNSIKEIEEKYNIQIPQLLKNIIVKYNGGRPLANIFLTDNKKEKVIKTLLSYNKEDKENIYIYDDIFAKDYIPFANTEFGDTICINNKNANIELYNHEADRFEYISENIETFFNMIYYV